MGNPQGAGWCWTTLSAGAGAVRTEQRPSGAVMPEDQTVLVKIHPDGNPP